MNHFTGKNLLMVGLLCAVCILSMRTCKRKAEKVEQFSQVIQLQHDTIVHFKDRTGKEHIRVVVQQADISTLVALHRTEIDSLTSLLNIKEKQIEAVIFSGSKTAGTIKPKIDTVFKDSAHSNYNLSYQDKWLKLNGTIGEQTYINYEYRDSLAFTTFKDKKGLIKVDAYSLNPNTKLSGLTSLQIPPMKPKRFGIGPYMGISYTQGKWVPQLGVGVQYNLIRF